VKSIANALKAQGVAHACARALIVGLLLCCPQSSQASQTESRGSPNAASATRDAPPMFEGPPAPVAPAVIARDPMTGRATIRAVRRNEPLRVDGRLDEAIYDSVPAISDFVQMEPNAGAPATERTEVWILFDEANVYVTFRC
jgi:hypothetical protein